MKPLLKRRALGWALMTTAAAWSFGVAAPCALAQEPDLREQAAQAFINQDHDAAYVLLTQAIEEEVASAQEYLYKGLIERQRGQLDQARRSFNAGLKQDPASISLLMELAVTCSWDGKLKEAVALYDKVMALTSPPEDTAARLGKARVVGWMGEHQQAIAIYRGILEAQPAHVEAMSGLATIHRALMQDTQASALYQQVLTITPDHPEALEGMALIEARTPFAWSSAVSAVSSPDQTNVQSQTHINWQLNPTWSFHAGHAMLSAAGNWIGVDDARQHTLSVGATFRPSESWTTGATYSAVLSEQGLGHRLGLDASYRLTASVALMAGLRPEIDPQEQVGVLVRGGFSVQWASWWGSWLQAFASQSPLDQRSVMLVAANRFELTQNAWLGMTAGMGQDDTGAVMTAGAELGIPLTDHLNLTLGYEHLRRVLPTHTARLGLQGRF